MTPPRAPLTDRIASVLLTRHGGIPHSAVERDVTPCPLLRVDIFVLGADTKYADAVLVHRYPHRDAMASPSMQPSLLPLDATWASACGSGLLK